MKLKTFRGGTNVIISWKHPLLLPFPACEHGGWGGRAMKGPWGPWGCPSACWPLGSGCPLFLPNAPEGSHGTDVLVLSVPAPGSLQAGGPWGGGSVAVENPQPGGWGTLALSTQKKGCFLDQQQRGASGGGGHGKRRNRCARLACVHGQVPVSGHATLKRRAWREASICVCVGGDHNKAGCGVRCGKTTPLSDRGCRGWA